MLSSVLRRTLDGWAECVCHITEVVGSHYKYLKYIHTYSNTKEQCLPLRPFKDSSVLKYYRLPALDLATSPWPHAHIIVFGPRDRQFVAVVTVNDRLDARLGSVITYPCGGKTA
jgi:hypothetical protein